MRKEAAAKASTLQPGSDSWERRGSGRESGRWGGATAWVTLTGPWKARYLLKILSGCVCGCFWKGLASVLAD